MPLGRAVIVEPSRKPELIIQIESNKSKFLEG